MAALPSLRMMENTFIYMHHTWPNGLLHKSVRLKNEISTEFLNYTSSWIRLPWVDGWVNEQNLKPNFSSTVHIPRNMHHIKHPYQADWCNEHRRLSITQSYIILITIMESVRCELSSHCYCSIHHQRYCISHHTCNLVCFGSLMLPFMEQYWKSCQFKIWT